MLDNDESFEVKWFGHCFDPTENHDKVWGWCVVGGKLYNFWGRRLKPEEAKTGKTKALKFKRNENGRWGEATLNEVTRKKSRKYQSYSVRRDSEGRLSAIEAVYPNFEEVLKEELFKARLMGNVMNEG